MTLSVIWQGNLLEPGFNNPYLLTPNLSYICEMKFFSAIIVFTALIIHSCNTVDLYEKSVSIPGHKWENSFRPSFDFTINDTTALYKVYMVLRHSEKYRYTNIYVNLTIQPPGQDSSIRIRRDLPLATNAGGWLGTGMDDIYEHRILLGDAQTLKAGTYKFTLEQIMREDPLEHVLNAGIRVEKQQK